MPTPSAATDAGVGLFDIAAGRLCVSYQDVFLDILAQYPELAAIAPVVIRAIQIWQGSLSWYEYRTFHGIKRAVLKRTGITHPKGGRNDDEFLRTIDLSPKTIAQRLRKNGGDLHLLASMKRRPAAHGDPLTAAHVVFYHDDTKQTEAYLFANDDGSSDVYVHVETATTDPDGHLTDTQIDGDARGRVRAALADFDPDD